MELLSQEQFLRLEEFTEANKAQFKVQVAKQVNPALGNLVAWVLGVLEFHKFLRGYSLSTADLQLLSPQEQDFCREMDALTLKNLRVLRFLKQKQRPEESELMFN